LIAETALATRWTATAAKIEFLGWCRTCHANGTRGHEGDLVDVAERCDRVIVPEAR
jgi:hypothetical protein